MVIRSLDNPSDSLSVIMDEQNDVYVTIRHKGDTYKDSHEFTVRIGGPGSGHRIPPKLKQALLQVAHEFDVYKDCKNEGEASLLVDKRETASWLRTQIGAAEAMLANCGQSDILMRRNLESHIEDWKEQLAKI